MTRRTLLRALLASGGVAVGAAASGGAWMFRTVAMPAQDWHADPDAPGATTGKPNEYRIAPGGDRAPILAPEPPERVAARIAAVAEAEPRTERIAGSVAGGHMTFVQRSAVMGFPDAISVKVTAEGVGSRVSVWSRSRYGHSDFGVNRRRVERWLEGAGLAAQG